MKTEYKWIVGIGSTLAVGFIIVYFINKKMKKGGSNAVWDSASEKLIETLHPKIRDKAREFINKAEKEGIKLRVTSGFRTYEEQDKLYAQGRTTSGQVVTNASAGHSNHNFGTAFDVVPIINGKADYDNGDWDKIGQLGKSVGFKWGGDWSSIIDKPHFEMTFGNSTADMRNKIAQGNVKDGYVILA